MGSGVGELSQAALLVLALLNAALVVHFYKECFKLSTLAVKERVTFSVQSYLQPPPFGEDAGYELAPNESRPAWLERDEDADMVMAQGFTAALGLSPYGNVHVQTENERLQLRGARLLQKFMYDKQINACKRGEKVDMYELPKEHNYGLFSQTLGIAHSLLDALAHGYVLSWSAYRLLYVDPTRCPSRGLECLFLPVTSCKREVHARSVKTDVRNSCVFEMPKRRLHQQPFIVNASDWRDMLPVLRDVTGIASLGRPDLFNAHFFAREALRFVTRPNSDLIRVTRDILNTDLRPPEAWYPFSPSIRRVAVHIRAGSDKKGHTGILGADRYAQFLQSYATLGLEQIMFSSDDRDSHAQFERSIGNITTNGCASTGARKRVQGKFIHPERFGEGRSMNQDYLYGVKKNETVPVEVTRPDIGMLLMAQSFIFATADVFVGLFASNVALSIMTYMSALRHTSDIPAFDAAGGPWPICHQFSEHPLRFIRHPDMTIS